MVTSGRGPANGKKALEMDEYIKKADVLEYLSARRNQVLKSPLSTLDAKFEVMEMPPTLPRCGMGSGTQMKPVHSAERSQQKAWTQKNGTTGFLLSAHTAGARWIWRAE